MVQLPDNGNSFENRTRFKNPSPLVLYCKNERSENFLGEAIDGFSARFCNDFHPTPTDVGICMTKNVDIKSIIHLEEEYFDFLDADNRTAKIKISSGNRNAENTFVLLTDIFEDLNGDTTFSKSYDVILFLQYISQITKYSFITISSLDNGSSN